MKRRMFTSKAKKAPGSPRMGNMRLLMGYFCEGNDRKVNWNFGPIRTRDLQSSAESEGKLDEI